MTPPAEAARAAVRSTNWSGIVGKPKALGSAPVTHVEINFIIPDLVCTTPGVTEVAIWGGMDAAGLVPTPNPRTDLHLTQAGVLGECDKGVPSWAAFYEAWPEMPMRPIPEFQHMHTGQYVSVTLDYRPDIAPGAFVTDFNVMDSAYSPIVHATKTFLSLPGATQRQRVDCIVERPFNIKPPYYNDLAHFKIAPTALGSTFSVNCQGGNSTKGFAFIAGDNSNHLLVNMESEGAHKHLLATSAISRPKSGTAAYVDFNWLASR